MSSISRIYGYTGGGSGSGASVDVIDGAGFCFGRDDLLVSAAAVPTPGSPGTSFSWLKHLVIYFTTADFETNEHRKVFIAETPAIPAGVAMWWANQLNYYANTGNQDASVSGSVQGNYPGDQTVDLSGLGLPQLPVAYPTTTLNGAHSAGASALTVGGAPGTNFRTPQALLVGAGTANAEIVQVNGTTTSTSIPCTALAKSHSHLDVVGVAYQPLTTTPVLYDDTTIFHASGPMGNFVVLVAAVDSTFAQGPGICILPSVQLQYDES